MKTGRDRDGSVERLLRRSSTADGSSTARDSGECPDTEILAAWIDGGLSQQDMALVEAHASECVRCQALLAAVVQTVPDPSLPASQETWRHSWGLRWLVPLAASAAAAVILWVAMPNDQRPGRPEQASAQLPNGSPTPPQQEAETRHFNAPTVGLEQPNVANGTTAARAADKTTSGGALERDEQKKEDARSKDQAATERLDKLGAETGSAPAEANAAQPRSAVNETAAVLRQTAKAASLEITSPDPSIRWRIGAGASVEHTTNGGITWEAVPTGTSVDLTAGASPAPLVCWLVGRAGTVLLSTDGRTWRRMPFPDMADLTAVQAVDAQTAMISLADGRKLRTTDGGLTWK